MHRSARSTPIAAALLAASLAAQACAHPAAAASPAAGPVWLPELALDGDEPCAPEVVVQNPGALSIRAVLVIWSNGEHDAPECHAPSGAYCTGLLGPGAAWRFGSEHWLAESEPSHGAVLAIDASGATHTEREAVDRICAAAAALPGDCAAWGQLLEASRSGGTFAGLPIAAGASRPVLASAQLACPLPGRAPTSALAALGALPDDAGSRAWHAPLPWPIALGDLGAASIHLQNAGSTPVTAVVTTEAEAECGLRSPCGAPIAIVPGARARLPVSRCLADPWHGHVRIEADGPLAVAVVVWDAEGNHVVAHGAVPAAGGAASGQLAAALVHDPSTGWDNRVVVYNHEATEVEVRAELRDATGAAVTERSAVLCPGGSRTLAFEHTASLPGRALGTLRVEGTTRAGDALRPARVSGLALLERWSDGATPEREQALSVPLADVGEPVGVLAAAQLVNGASPFSSDRTARVAELVLASHATAPGWTDVAIVLFDQNAALDVLCRRLDTGAVAYVDPTTLGRLDAAFRGSAVISAVAWSHADGSGPRLGGVNVLRRGTVFGAPAPGDETAAIAMVPIAPPPAAIGARPMACSPGGAPLGPPLVTRPPASAAARESRVALPVLASTWRPEDGDCAGRVDAVNRGERAAVLLFVSHGLPGPCEPGCAGPSSAQCSGLVAPGEAWTWSPPAEARSAVLFALSDATLPSLGLPGEGLAADALCAALRAAAGRCDGYAALAAAWDAGASYAGLPLQRLYGGRVGAEVVRDCSSPVVPSAPTVVLRYDAVPEAVPIEDDGAFRLVTPGVFADQGGHSSILHLQNVGSRCTDVSVWFRSAANCLRQRLCTVPAIAPGETVAFDASDCIGPEFVGTAILRAREPLAAVVDVVDEPPGREPPEAHNHAVMAFPGRNPFDLDGDGRVGQRDLDAVQAAAGRAQGDAAWDARLDLYPDGRIDARDEELVRQHRCASADAPPVLEPPLDPPRSADRVFLPAAGSDGRDGPCGAEIWIQNLGDRPARLLALGWRPAEGVEPGGPCPGPAAATCTGLVAPGGTWRTRIVDGFDVPDPREVAAASVWAVADVRASEAGIELPGDPSLADVLCQRLAAGGLDTCATYGELVAAWEAGATWQGVPLGAVRGGALSASVTRTCTADVTPDFGATTTYTAPARPDLGPRDDQGRYAYALPLVYANKAGYDTVIHVQNAGAASAEVAWEAAFQDDCSYRQACEGVRVDPGASIALRAADCVGPDSQPSVRVVADQPLAIVVELFGHDVRMAYPAIPARRDADAAGAALEPGAGTVAFAPWIPSPSSGWDSAAQVMNLDPVRTAFVRVSQVDAHGAVAWVLDDRVCPSGSQMYFFPITRTDDGVPPGTIVVESVPGPGDGPLPPPAIEGVLIGVRYADPGRSRALAAAVEPMVPGPLGFRWPDGQGAEGVAAGTAVVAVPGVGGRDAYGAAQRIAVANLVRLPGATDVGIQVLDAQGARVAETCLRLAAGGAALVDVAALGLDDGFYGSALVSAVAWSHAAPDGRRLVGLSAAALHTTGSGGAGDPMGLGAGEPLRAGPTWLRAPSATCPPPASLPSATPTRPGTAMPTRTPTATETVVPAPVGRAYLPWGSAGR